MTSSQQASLRSLRSAAAAGATENKDVEPGGGEGSPTAIRDAALEKQERKRKRLEARIARKNNVGR